MTWVTSEDQEGKALALCRHAHGAGLGGSLIGLVTVEDINCAGFGEDLFGHGFGDAEMGVLISVS